MSHARTHTAEHQRSRYRHCDCQVADRGSAATTGLRDSSALGAVARTSVAGRILARTCGEHEHRESARTCAADFGLVRRLAWSDRLHERAECCTRTSAHPIGHGSGRAQRRGLRGRRLRTAVARGNATIAAALVRSFPGRQGQRRGARASGGSVCLWRQCLAQGSRVAIGTCEGNQVVCGFERAREYQQGRRNARHVATARRRSRHVHLQPGQSNSVSHRFA